MGVKLKKINGAWYIVINYHGRRKSKKIGSREAAEEVRRKVEARLALGDMGIFSDSENTAPTFEQYADKWLNTHVRVRRKDSTFFAYDSALRTHIFPRLGKRHLDRIEPADIESFVYSLTTQNKPPSQNTIRLVFSVLRSLLGHARKNRVIVTNPASGLGELARSDKPERKGQSMSKKESESFLAAVQEIFPEMYPFFLTALRTGMRRGELAALQWGDCNFGESDDDSNRYFLVQRTWTNRRFGSPKSGKPRRVDMTKQLRAVLLALRDERMLSAMQQGKTSIANDLIFPGDDGAPMVVEYLTARYFEPALAKAGLRRFRFHDLRHTYGTLLIQAGVSLAYVQKQMGHSSIKITVDIYGHLEPGGNIAWADRLDEKTSPQENANQAQMGEKREMIGAMEPVDAATVSSHSEEMPRITSPYAIPNLSL